MKSKTLMFMVFCLSLAVYSCSSDDDNSEKETTDETNDSEVLPTDFSPNSQEIAPANAVFIKFTANAVEITNPFENKGISTSNTAGHAVIESTITDQEINYVVSGITTNGSLKIYGTYKFNLLLNGTSITNPQGAAINIQCGKKITVQAVDKTNNQLMDGTVYTLTEGEDMKGTLFSEGQLIFMGTGTLSIIGKYKHAIATDDYCRIQDGDITIIGAVGDAIHANDYIQIDGGKLTTKTAGDGLDCEEGYITIVGGTQVIKTTGKKGHGLKSETDININTTGTLDVSVEGIASKGMSAGANINIYEGSITIKTAGSAVYETEEADFASPAGIKCDGELIIEGGVLNITSSGAGGKGISADGNLVINNGIITVVTSGDNFVYNNDNTAAKAIKSDANVTINGGTISIKTSKTEAEGLESKDILTITGGTIEIEAHDDCINASNHINISGGKIYCNSTTNDGMDSNGTIAISGGLVIALGAAVPEAGIDADNNRFAITGGTIIGLGGSTSTPTASASTQRSVVYTTNTANIQTIAIQSSDSKSILTLKLPRTYQQSTCLLYSDAQMLPSTTYTIRIGGTITGDSQFHGIYTGATWSGGSTATTFTTSSMVTTIGGTGGGRP